MKTEGLHSLDIKMVFLDPQADYFRFQRDGGIRVSLPHLRGLKLSFEFPLGAVSIISLSWFWRV